jgi:hypothetical protein
VYKTIDKNVARIDDDAKNKLMKLIINIKIKITKKAVLSP